MSHAVEPMGRFGDLVGDHFFRKEPWGLSQNGYLPQTGHWPSFFLDPFWMIWGSIGQGNAANFVRTIVFYHSKSSKLSEV